MSLEDLILSPILAIFSIPSYLLDLIENNTYIKYALIILFIYFFIKPYVSLAISNNQEWVSFVIAIMSSPFFYYLLSAYTLNVWIYAAVIAYLAYKTELLIGMAFVVLAFTNPSWLEGMRLWIIVVFSLLYVYNVSKIQNYVKRALHTFLLFFLFFMIGFWSEEMKVIFDLNVIITGAIMSGIISFLSVIDLILFRTLLRHASYVARIRYLLIRKGQLEKQKKEMEKKFDEQINNAKKEGRSNTELASLEELKKTVLAQIDAEIDSVNDEIRKLEESLRKKHG